jgi:hypothetical protein
LRLGFFVENVWMLVTGRFATFRTFVARKIINEVTDIIIDNCDIEVIDTIIWLPFIIWDSLAAQTMRKGLST